MQAMSPITSILSAALALKDAKPAEIESVINTVGQSMVRLMDQMSSTVTNIIEALSGPGLTEGQVRSATAVASVISSFATLLEAFSGPIREVTEVNRLFRSDTRTTIDNASIGEQIASIDQFLSSLSGNDGALSRIGTSIEQIGQLDITEEGLQKVTAVTGLIGTITDFYGEVASFNDDQVGDTVATFESIVTAYNEFYRNISNLETSVDMNAALGRFAGSLGIQNETVSIENHPVNVTVNLNVTMDAADIATVLSSDSVGSNRLLRATGVNPQ